MQEQPNPYAPPRAETDFDSRLAGSSAVLQRQGDLVLIPAQGASFPARCVLCNEPAPHRLRRKLWWHPSWYYALICLGWLVYVIAAMIVRKSAELEVGLCDRHMARRRYAFVMGLLGVPVCLVGGGVLVGSTPIAGTLLFVVALGLLVAAVVMARTVTASRIADGFAWIKVGRPFLDSLP